MTEQLKFSRIAMAAARALSSEPNADVELYLPTSQADGPVLYRKAGVGLTKPDFKTLESSGVQYVYVRSKDLRRCEALLEARLGDLLKSRDTNTAEKTRIVHQVGTAVARDLIEDPTAPSGVGRAATVVDNVIGFVLENPLVARNMLQMAAHERSTASHMFLVSALAIILGSEVFGEDYNMLNSLGLAGMMHDLGKLGIDPRILNKATALTAEEALLIQQHPVESVRLLGNDAHASPAVRQMIVQHHEWVNGGGYPIGLFGEDLHPGSRVLSIVDAFHAMIGRRPYRTPMTPPDAVRVLNTQSGRQFDPKVLGAWSDLFERSWSADSKQPQLALDQSSEDAGSRHEHRPVPERSTTRKRRSRRFDCAGDVRVKCFYAGSLNVNTTAEEFVAPIRDVSRSGICMFSPDPMYRGEVIHVQIEQGDMRVWVRGVVVWCRQHDLNIYRVGVQFVQRISDEEAHEHLQVVAAHPLDASETESVPKTNMQDRKRESRPRRLDELNPDDALLKLTAVSAVRPMLPQGEQTAISLLSSPDRRVRLKAVEVLTAAGSEAAWEALLSLRRDSDPEVRERAAEASRSFKPSTAIV